jgi:hypothetical protein
MDPEDSAASPVRLRFPTLELYSALHGGSLSLGGRPLGRIERKEAEFIFGASIDLNKVRIVRAVVANAPTTLGNYIRVPMNGSLDYQTLIHELMHIWQYQTMGTRYISDSICHQVGASVATGSRNAAYDVTEADLSANSISDLPAEKQAMVVETYFANPFVRNDPNYRRFIGQVRGARPLAESLILEEAAFGPSIGQLNLLDDPNRSADRLPGVVSLIRIEL